MQRTHGLAHLQAGLLTRGRIYRAQQGLYHGRQKQYGDHVSYSMHRTKRTWSPNVQWKTFHSELLDRRFQVRVTTGALRVIDKAGGIDNYLLFTSERKIDSEVGMELKQYLVDAWEKKNGRSYNRRQLVMERKLAAFDTGDAIDRPWIEKALSAEL